MPKRSFLLCFLYISCFIKIPELFGGNYSGIRISFGHGPNNTENEYYYLVSTIIRTLEYGEDENILNHL